MYNSRMKTANILICVFLITQNISSQWVAGWEQLRSTNLSFPRNPEEKAFKEIIDVKSTLPRIKILEERKFLSKPILPSNQIHMNNTFTEASLIYYESFNNGFPLDWNIIDGPEQPDGKTWRRGIYANNPSDVFMFVPCYQKPFVWMDEELISPSFNFTGQSKIVLRFWNDFEYRPFVANEIGDVDIKVGHKAWENIFRFTNNDNWGWTSIDISSIAAMRPDISIRWHYYNALEELYWLIDDVQVWDSWPYGNSLSLYSARFNPNPCASSQVVQIDDLTGWMGSLDDGIDTRIVAGLRDESGNWVGGDPIIVWTGMPELFESYWRGDLAEITAPTIPGTYYLWIQHCKALNNSAAIQQFKNNIPISENSTNKRWSEYLLVLEELPLEFFADFRRKDIVSQGITIEIGPYTEYNWYRGVHYSYRMLAQGSSYIKGTFSLDTAPTDPMYLTVRHLSSSSPGVRGGGYSPIDIVINDSDSDPFNENNLLVDNFDPAENHDFQHGMVTDSFEIPPEMLQQGENTIIFANQSIETSQTHYWLQNFRIHSAPAGLIQLHTNNYSTDEAAGYVSVRVLRTSGSQGNVTIDYATTDTTATAGSDYTAVTGTITFTEGQTTKIIKIPILPDSDPEGLETFTLNLSNPTGEAILGTPASGIVTILDDELGFGPAVIYVDPNAIPGGDGTSWATAYQDLQDALAGAASMGGDFAEIWVAAGIYKPDQGTQDRNTSFVLLENVGLYGGFAGWETERSERDPFKNPTILSGDLNGDDIEGFINVGENSYHVLLAYGVGPTAILDGFIITGGKTRDDYVDYTTGGGGLFCVNASPTIRNCIFKHNTGTDGGAIFNYLYSNPTLLNCQFIQNTNGGHYYTVGGGAIANWISHPWLVNCAFRGNDSHIDGGSMFNWDGKPVLDNCTLISNRAQKGGAIYNLDANWGSYPTLTNCIVKHNAAILGADLCLVDQANIFINYCDMLNGEKEIWVDQYSSRTFNWGPGNMDSRDLITPDGHVPSSSEWINAGITSGAPEFDIDSESRPNGGGVEIGVDEFIDLDGDKLPNWWEKRYFNSPIAANPGGDLDGDGLTNLQEYELFSSNPIAPPYYVDPVNGNDSYDGLSITPQGGSVGPKATLQAALDLAGDGDTVLAVAGSYRGPGNKNLDFHGKAIVLKSLSGSSSTIIDCEHSGQGFYFHTQETPATVVNGFTITNGLADKGGALRLECAHPQIRNCNIDNCYSIGQVGAIYCEQSSPILADCRIEGFDPNVIWARNSEIQINGVVNLISNTWIGDNIALTGDGILHLDTNAILDMQNSVIRCDLAGAGTVWVAIDAELIIEGRSVIDMSAGGIIQCDGLLRVRGSASVQNTHIIVTRASFEDDINISNSVIKAEAGAPYGQFFIEDTANISNNEIHADGDRYMDLDPSIFAGLIQNNKIFVTITEGTDNTLGGLLELRGMQPNDLPYIPDPGCDPNEYLCQMNVPEFDPNTWTIEELRLIKNAKVNLTNRFDFHGEEQGPYEVMYVKKLILEPNSVLNTAFNKLYYENPEISESAVIKNVPLLGFSYNNITFDNPIDYATRIMHNNSSTRTHITQVFGQSPDPAGMMRMCNQIERDSAKPFFMQVVNARAKGLFAKANEERILIRFEYLFDTPDPNAFLIVYLTDTPMLLDHNDPNRAEHYLEVALLPAPPPGDPGSFGSNRFGVFQIIAENTLDLNFIKGLRLELELVGKENACAYINNWDPSVDCDDTYCGDITADFAVNVEDFLTALGSYGQTTGIMPDNMSLGCLDTAFSQNGYLTVNDLMGWDWRDNFQVVNHLCTIPIVDGQTQAMSTPSELMEHFSDRQLLSNRAPNLLSDLLITGKKYSKENNDKIRDSLYFFDEWGKFLEGYNPITDRMNGRLIQDSDGHLYQINLQDGLQRLTDGFPIIGQGSWTYSKPEPRYNTSGAAIHIGMQGNNSEWWGRPLVDAAFDSDGNLYVVPVIVEPINEPAYLAAARLEPNELLLYHPVQLYAVPQHVNSNKNYNHPYEIEVDQLNNVYVMNSYYINESDILWVFDAETGIENEHHVFTGPESDCNIPAPIALSVSDVDDDLRIYLASSLNSPHATSTQIYGLSKTDFSLERVITIRNMGHVTDITQDPVTGTLWVVGFEMDYIDDTTPIVPNQPVFYHPRLARILLESTEVEAVSLSDLQHHDLALPLSVIKLKYCAGADWDSSGTVDLPDLHKLSLQWMEDECNGLALAPSDWCFGADLNRDGYVNLKDIVWFSKHWLETMCVNSQ